MAVLDGRDGRVLCRPDLLSLATADVPVRGLAAPRVLV